jgi:hypothetical protein
MPVQPLEQAPEVFARDSPKSNCVLLAMRATSAGRNIPPATLSMAKQPLRYVGIQNIAC